MNKHTLLIVDVCPTYHQYVNLLCENIITATKHPHPNCFPLQLENQIEKYADVFIH